MHKFVVYNGFGILPSKNFTAAGYDFYIPNIDSSDEELKKRAFEAFSVSYNKSFEELKIIYDALSLFVSSAYGKDRWETNDMNILHLFLALDAPYKMIDDIEYQIDTFISERLIFTYSSDKSQYIAGIMPEQHDYLLINSGIKTKFEHEYAGIFENKSGKGTKGWDVRACVVDEDYTGYVHMSLAFDKPDNSKAAIYCGDKISQMVIYYVPETNIESVDIEEFNRLHSASKRGTDGFGSSDMVH